MRLGYGVDVLGRLPWLAKARSIYWGDVDTHGFAILNRARTYLPELESILMDEETLLSNKDLWGEEREQHSAESLALLSIPRADGLSGSQAKSMGSIRATGTRKNRLGYCLERSTDADLQKPVKDLTWLDQHCHGCIGECCDGLS
jgi:hypothetical protein